MYTNTQNIVKNVYHLVYEILFHPLLTYSSKVQDIQDRTRQIWMHPLGYCNSFNVISKLFECPIVLQEMSTNNLRGGTSGSIKKQF